MHAPTGLARPLILRCKPTPADSAPWFVARRLPLRRARRLLAHPHGEVGRATILYYKKGEEKIDTTKTQLRSHFTHKRAACPTRDDTQLRRSGRGAHNTFTMSSGSATREVSSPGVHPTGHLPVSPCPLPGCYDVPSTGGQGPDGRGSERGALYYVGRRHHIIIP